MEKKSIHAWYSRQAALRLGTALYKREDGSTVEVTYVTENPNGFDGEFYKWADKEYRGIVVKYVGPGRRGLIRKDLLFKEKSLSMSTRSP